MPRLADKGIYLASETTIYRVLRRYGEVHRRGRQLRVHKVPAPTTFTASAPYLKILLHPVTKQQALYQVDGILTTYVSVSFRPSVQLAPIPGE